MCGFKKQKKALTFYSQSLICHCNALVLLSFIILPYKTSALQPGVFERFERACQAAEPDADRSAGNGGKSVVFRKNIGNFRKIRGGIDMMCPAFSKK